MRKKNYLNTIVIGGGQAGLACGYYLSKAAIDHILIEKNKIASSWDKTWDSFSLATPNWMNTLAGLVNKIYAQDVFLTKNQWHNLLTDYARKIRTKILEGTEAIRVCRDKKNKYYIIDTNKGFFLSKNIIFAVGSFHNPHIPWAAKKVGKHILQLHSSEYKNKNQVSDNVLVVGSGQSGIQISDELNISGKQVFLSTGEVGWAPRNYRGKDITEWIDLLGIFDERLPSLTELDGKFPTNFILSGANSKETIDLIKLNKHGVRLFGRLSKINNNIINFADDLQDNLNYGICIERRLCQDIDNYISKNNLNAPKSKPKTTNFNIDTEKRIDLVEKNIKTIIWATGYEYNYNWIELNILDEYGCPVAKNGISPLPGIYFIGLRSSNKIKSGFIYGVNELAKSIVKHITASTFTKPT